MAHIENAEFAITQWRIRIILVHWLRRLEWKSMGEIQKWRKSVRKTYTKHLIEVLMWIHTKRAPLFTLENSLSSWNILFISTFLLVHQNYSKKWFFGTLSERKTLYSMQFVKIFYYLHTNPSSFASSSPNLQQSSMLLLWNMWFQWFHL